MNISTYTYVTEIVCIFDICMYVGSFDTTLSSDTEVYWTWRVRRVDERKIEIQIEFHLFFTLFRVGTIATFLRVRYTIDEMSRYFYNTMTRDGDSDIVLCRENSRLLVFIRGFLFLLCRWCNSIICANYAYAVESMKGRGVYLWCMYADDFNRAGVSIRFYLVYIGMGRSD